MAAIDSSEKNNQWAESNWTDDPTVSPLVELSAKLSLDGETQCLIFINNGGGGGGGRITFTIG